MPERQSPKCSIGARLLTFIALPHEASLERATDSSEAPLDDEPFIELLVAQHEYESPIIKPKIITSYNIIRGLSCPPTKSNATNYFH